MKLKYAPEGAEAREWQFSEDDLTVGEVKLLEKVHGMPFGEVGELAARGSMTVISSLIWVMRKRGEPGLQLVDLDDMRIGDMEFTDDEEPGAEPEVPKDPAPTPALPVS